MEFTDEMLKKVIVPGKGMPIYIDERPPDLEDPAKSLADYQWQAGCGATNKLTRCLEAIRDLKSALAPLAAEAQHASEKRLLKQAIIPVYNFATALRDLYNYVQSNCWPAVSKNRQKKLVKRFEEFTASVPTKVGTLKTARDKIGAHLDKDISTSEYRQFWESFEIGDMLVWIHGCVRMLDAILRPDIYSWSRSSGYDNVVNLMRFDGNEVSILINDAEPKAIVGLRLAVSPKEGIAREVRELGEICMALEKGLGKKPGKPEGPS